jgi:hypothetical protein
MPAARRGLFVAVSGLVLMVWASSFVLVRPALSLNQAPPGPPSIPNGPILVSIEPEPIYDSSRRWLAEYLGKDPATWYPTLADLPNESVLITVKSFDREGRVSYIAAGAARKETTYEITQDYMKYVSVKEPRIARYGISLRIRATVIAKSSKFDLAGLLPVGLAANQGRATGTLSVEVTGIQSRDVTNALPLPAQLSQESVMAAIQAAATIKSRIYDGGDAVEPVAKGAGARQAKALNDFSRTRITIQRIAEEKLASEVEQISPGVYQIKLPDLK